MPQILTDPIRFMYMEAYRKFQQLTYPEAVRDHGFLTPKYPDTRTANGLTMFVINFINWNGGNATRISSSGRMLGKRYIPGTTRKGTADVTATIRGRSVKLEIKAGSDRPSPFQLAEQRRERAAGGVYEFIHDPEQFIIWYDQFISNL